MDLPRLMLPGHMCDARLWSLAAMDGDCVDGDLTRDDSIAAMAQRVLAAAPTRFVAIGFSMGGIVALEIARVAPDRLAGVVLSDTNAGADLPERSAARLAQQAEVRGGGLRRVVGEELKPAYLAPENCARQDILDLVMAMAVDLGADVFARQSEALRLRPDATAVLPGIACPVLVLCGADDPLCPPAWHREMAATIPHARLAVVAGAGHLLPLEQPDAFAALIDTWRDQHAL